MERWDVLRLWKGEGLALILPYWLPYLDKIEDLFQPCQGLYVGTVFYLGANTDTGMLVVIKLLSHNQR